MLHIFKVNWSFTSSHIAAPLPLYIFDFWMLKFYLHLIWKYSYWIYFWILKISWVYFPPYISNSIKCFTTMDTKSIMLMTKLTFNLSCLKKKKVKCYILIISLLQSKLLDLNMPLECVPFYYLTVFGASWREFSLQGLTLYYLMLKRPFIYLCPRKSRCFLWLWFVLS